MTQAFKGSIYCSPWLRGQPKQGRTAKNYCPECNLHIRTTLPAHQNGEHHRLHIKKIADAQRRKI